MQQIIKQRHLLCLLLTFTAAEAFRHIGWMLFYEQLINDTRQNINFGFILYSATIMITAIIAPLALKRLHIIENPKHLKKIFISSISVAFLFRVLQLCSDTIGAYVFLVLWTAAIMICICICFINIFNSVPKSLFGRFIGTAYFIDALIVSFIECFTGTTSYYVISVLGALVLCVGAFFTYQHKPINDRQVDIEKHKTVFSEKSVLLGLVIMIVYAFIAGMGDSLYFFDISFELPFINQFTLPITAIMYLLGGFLFDVIPKKITLPLALVFICIAQSLPFFSTDAAFTYIHAVFFNFGSTFLELATLIIPICYAYISKYGISLVGVGEGIFYGGFCVTSILFIFIEESFYQAVMGIILLFTIVCLLMLFGFIFLYEKRLSQQELDHHRQIIASLEQKTVVAESLSLTLMPVDGQMPDIHFTKKERELLPLIISSLTAEEIADQVHLSASTIRFHIKNILSKANAKNRRELIRMFGEQSFKLSAVEQEACDK